MRSESEFNPNGFLDPVWCRNIRWMIIRATITKGRTKCSAKNRFKVALSTAKPPHNHSTKISPMYGIAENRLVITVAPQNLICPQGRTYPMNAVAIVTIKIITPIFHVSIKVYDW